MLPIIITRVWWLTEDPSADSDGVRVRSPPTATDWIDDELSPAGEEVHGLHHGLSGDPMFCISRTQLLEYKIGIQFGN